jgi:pimeloyl-ACP methyl ester carboxylesterase
VIKLPLPNLLEMNHIVSDDVIQALLREKNISMKLSFIDTHPNTDKPVMVLLHGNSASTKIFADYIQRYSNDFRVIAIDLMGHGNSTKICNLENLSREDVGLVCDAFYNFSALTHQVKYVLDTNKIKNAHFVGWSLGGHISYGLAILDLDLAASITTIGAPPTRFSHLGFKKGFSEWFVNTLVADWVNHPKAYNLDEAREIGMHIGFNGKDLEIFSKDMSESDPEFRKYLFLKLLSYDSDEYTGTCFDAETFIRETSMPVNMIVGQQDVGISSSHITEINKIMKNSLSATHVIAKASHAVFKTHADACHLIISEFIGKVIACSRLMQHS